MYRKYYSYSDMPQPVTDRHQSCAEPAREVHKKENEICEKEQNNKLFGKFDTDDIILAVVAVMLLANDCDDKLLLLALAFVFLSGLNF
jgi:hypothetical protein